MKVMPRNSRSGNSAQPVAVAPVEGRGARDGMAWPITA